MATEDKKQAANLGPIYLGPVPTHQPNTSSSCYGSDQTNDKDWEYSFNSLGYRGEEVDLNAPARILVTGDSNTVGEGVSWESTWGVQLKERLEEQSSSAQVSLLNVAQSGAPNDYVAREAIYAASVFKPTLVVALFSHITRKESARSDGKIEHIGPWREDEVSQLYYNFFTEEDGLANTLRNILMLQYFCRSTDTRFLWSVPEATNLFARQEAKHPVCARYLSLIDRTQCVPCNLFQFDLGADGVHPGPEGHRAFAESLFTGSLS